MKSVKKNFVYNMAYQILILILPLVTVPYVSRTLGTSGVGIYAYTYSIVYYFMIFSMLGINNYGNRTIAKVRDDKEKLSKTFIEIYFIQIIMSLIMILIYILYVILFDNNHKTIAFIQSLYILSCMFDINWFFFGNEDFKLTVTRNTIIKILSLICIFLFVKKSSDVLVYVLILSCGTLLSNLMLFPFLRKKIIKVKINIRDIYKHIVPCLKLFLPVIAVSIYKVMDKTMLGFFTNVAQVGIYENAEKIISVPNSIIAALGTVMLPRMSNLYSKNKIKETKIILEKSIKVIMFLAFPMMFGLIIIGNDFSLVFFGKEFIKSGYVIIALSVTLVFLSWGNVIRTQYLIPREYDKIYITSAFLGSIVNFILNLIYIPKFHAIGACIGTVLAELVVMLYQTLSIKNELPFIKYLKSIIPFLLKALIMFIIVYPINYIEINTIIKIIIEIILASLIYGILNIKFINEFVNIKQIIKKIKGKKA